MGAALAWESGLDAVTYLTCDLGSFTSFSGLPFSHL